MIQELNGCSWHFFLFVCLLDSLFWVCFALLLLLLLLFICLFAFVCFTLVLWCGEEWSVNLLKYGLYGDDQTVQSLLQSDEKQKLDVETAE